MQIPPDVLRALFAYPEQPNFPARYNIAPTQPVPVVRLWNGARQFVLMRWGFLPGWVKDPKQFPLVINVRQETAREKPSFRSALGRRRCLMPADGFYEWRATGKEKQPYLIRRPDKAAFAFAAIWEGWQGADGSEIDTVALLTGPANGTLSALHHRCPVILGPQEWESWLDADASEKDIQALMRPPADDALEMLPVSRAVNSVAHDGPEVQQPAERPPEKPPAQPSLF